MKPFNLERALAGDPVVTRDGRPVTQLASFKAKGQNTLYGVIDGYVGSWTPEGRWSVDVELPNDLFMAPTKRGGWMNVYTRGNDHYVARGGDIYESEERADKHAVPKRIACVYVEWEE